MDVPTPAHSLKEEVTCSVCSNVYTNPKQLPCLHIFCLECLNDLARTSAHHGSVKCPLCQSEVAVPETGTMETLPSCLHVKNLLDIFAIKECSTSKVTCGNCDEKHEEASYCVHCDNFWCHDCLNAHNILKENKLHRVLALKDIGNFEDVLKRPDMFVRQTSTIVDHASGDTNALADVMDNINCKLDTAKESSNTISNCIQLLEEETRLLDYRSKTNKEHIQQTVESLILTLQQKEQELVTEVENQTKEAHEQVMKRKDELQDQLNKREQSILQIEALVQRDMGAEFVTSTKPIIDKLLEGLQDQEMPSTTDWKTVTMFARNEEISESLQDLGIGHLASKKTTTELNQCSVKWFQTAAAGLETEIEVITRNSEGEQCYCPGDYITVQLISAQSRNTVVEMKIIDKNNGSYMISFIPSEAGQHLPTLQVNGETTGGFPPILIKERSFTPVTVIANGIIETQTLAKNLDRVAQASRPRSRQIEKSFQCPWGVTVNDSNEIFVSDMGNNRIVVFNETGKFVWSIRHKLLNKPSGICIDNQGRIFVANRGNGKVLLFNPKGEYITAVHNGGLLKEPRGISLDAQENLVVCDSSRLNKCVYILSPNGSILKTIGKGGLQFPFDCLCHDDKVFVSDRDAHLVKVYNHSNGRFLYEFGRYRNAVDVELNEPLGLAEDKLGNLLVCSGNLANDHKVNVFTLDGRFVTAFGGSRGGELGQFGKPTSATVLRNGRIVVCEFDNCRLQVFE